VLRRANPKLEMIGLVTAGRAAAIGVRAAVSVKRRRNPALKSIEDFPGREENRVCEVSFSRVLAASTCTCKQKQEQALREHHTLRLIRSIAGKRNGLYSEPRCRLI